MLVILKNDEQTTNGFFHYDPEFIYEYKGVKATVKKDYMDNYYNVDIIREENNLLSIAVYNSVILLGAYNLVEALVYFMEAVDCNIDEEDNENELDNR